jgi:hypothetical protein
MTLEQLEKQVLLWNKAAILVPIFVTGMLMVAYFFNMCSIDALFYIACGMYFFTAIVWWWWTMKSVHLLVKTLSATKEGVIEIATELKSIRKELQVDKITDK